MILNWMEDSVFVLVAYRRESGDRVGQALSNLIKDLWMKTRRSRFSIIIYTDVEKPSYMEHLRSFIQSNLANSLSVWWRPLDKIVKDLEETSVPKSKIYILVDKSLARELEVLKERVNVFEEF